MGFWVGRVCVFDLMILKSVRWWYVWSFPKRLMIRIQPPISYIYTASDVVMVRVSSVQYVYKNLGDDRPPT